MIVHTDAMERSVSAGTSYADCFKGVDRRRTEIATGVWVIQTTCGSSMSASPSAASPLDAPECPAGHKGSRGVL